MNEPRWWTARRRIPLLVLTLVVLVGSAACAGGATPAPTGTGGVSARPAGTGGAEGSAGAATAPASVPAGEFVNPVLADDFPDPFVLRVGDTYYAYATTDAAQHLQLAKSPDLVHWTTLSDPLPKLPAWSTGDTWAPEVAKIGDTFVLFYTAHDSDIKRPDSNGAQCVTAAISSKPEGPFVDDSKQPLVCQADQGGSIDATYFRDADGTAYLVWKNDGNCCGLPTHFWIQALAADGRSLTGKATDMGVSNDQQWEGSVIEAPTLLLKDGTYYLFYSANNYDSELYAVGYATASKVTGPFKDAGDNPILASAWGRPEPPVARGPGHQSVVTTADGQLWMAYHAWDKSAVGYENFGQRELWIDRLTVGAGKASVHGPTSDPQPIP